MNNLFQRKHLVQLMKLKKKIQQKVEPTSNGLENFGVEGETAPDLFSSDNEQNESDSFIIFRK